MDKFIKNAAIYLVVKSEKEDYYFITEKIKKMREACKREDIKITHIFIVSGMTDMEEKRKNLCEQIKKNKIQVLVIEEEEDVVLETVEMEKVCVC